MLGLLDERFTFFIFWINVIVLSGYMEYLTSFFCCIEQSSCVQKHLGTIAVDQAMRRCNYKLFCNDRSTARMVFVLKINENIAHVS